MSQTPNTNTTATGGYLEPATTEHPFGGLSFEDFLQTVLVGVSSLPCTMVRPKWQLNPPKQPDVCINWLAFGMQEDDADFNAYDSANSDGSNIYMRMEALTLQCSFYGPNSLSIARLTRDNFQIAQNRQALQSASMDFVSMSKLVRAPDLVNERWVDRWEATVSLRREVLRSYPILTFASVGGDILVDQSGGVKTIAFSATG